MRIQKRDGLPEESDWRQPKFDAAMVYTLMTDDEDELDVSGKKTGRFATRPLTYRTKIVSKRVIGHNRCTVILPTQFQDLLDTIDAGANPRPSNKYVICAVGTPLDELPPLSVQKISHRARRWMVRPEWLAEADNKKYNTPQRIIDNGKVWGDTHDPEELLMKAKEIAQVKAEIRAGKKPKVENSVATAIADVFRKNCLFRLLKLAKIVGIFDKIGKTKTKRSPNGAKGLEQISQSYSISYDQL